METIFISNIQNRVSNIFQYLLISSNIFDTFRQFSKLFFDVSIHILKCSTHFEIIFGKKITFIFIRKIILKTHIVFDFFDEEKRTKTQQVKFNGFCIDIVLKLMEFNGFKWNCKMFY